MEETLYISLGGSCAVTYNLRKHLSKKHSDESPSISNGYGKGRSTGPSKGHRFPFDWAKTSIKQLNNVLEKDFENYDKLEVKKFSENHPLLLEEAERSERSERRDERSERSERRDERSERSDERSDELSEPREQEVKDESLDVHKTQGSLILKNPYGITFAHQIIEKSGVESFSYYLRTERVTAFKTISQNVNYREQIILEKMGKIQFIRFETGKLGNSYISDLKILIQHLSKYLRRSFKLVLLVHETHSELFKDTKIECLKVIYFQKYDNDWTFPSIDWGSVFSDL
jgi:hypothetical protein